MKRVISLLLAVALVSTLLVGCSCGQDKKIDKEAGFEVDKYIKLGEYKDFTYNIDQKKFDEMLAEKTYEATEVNRAAKMGDEIEFSYKGYINDKKVDDLSQNNIAAETDQKDNSTYKKMTDALIGKKKGDTVTVKLSGKDASKVSKDNKKYSESVTFKLSVKEVSGVKYPKVTNDWVKNESNEDVNTVEEFFDIVKDELDDNAIADLWQKAVDNATMSSWPPALYDKIKKEEIADAEYNADEWDMSLDEYYAMNGDTKETLEKEYMNQVKSILVMWAIVKAEDLEVTSKDIEQRYQDLLLELEGDDDYKTIDDVKKNYPKSEIKEAVYLDKAQNFVYKHSKVKKTYKVHNNK